MLNHILPKNIKNPQVNPKDQNNPINLPNARNHLFSIQKNITNETNNNYLTSSSLQSSSQKNEKCLNKIVIKMKISYLIEYKISPLSDNRKSLFGTVIVWMCDFRAL
jgi:hypothetical protein